jgi:hypothetical protein
MKAAFRRTILYSSVVHEKDANLLLLACRHYINDGPMGPYSNFRHENLVAREQ